MLESQLSFLLCHRQNDQGTEGSADFSDTDHSSGIGDDEDAAEGSGDDHLTDEEVGSGTVGPGELCHAMAYKKR